jgi:hypothetical protein
MVWKAIIGAIAIVATGFGCSRKDSTKTRHSDRVDPSRPVLAAPPADMTGGIASGETFLHPLHVGGPVTAPVLIQRVEPNLPQRLSVAGPLMLASIIDKHGIVRDVRIIRDGTRPAVGPAYVAAVRKWRFRPGTLHGEPVDVELDMSVIVDVR